MDTYEYVRLLKVAIGILKEINSLLEKEVKAVSPFQTMCIRIISTGNM